MAHHKKSAWARGQGTWVGDRALIATPSDRRLLLTQLFTWFVTLAFATLATFETIYFFACTCTNWYYTQPRRTTHLG